MTKALTAVGAALALALLVLGLVIYLNREEDAIAVDNLLAESITREIGTAEQRGEDVDLSDVDAVRLGHGADRRARPRPARTSRARSDRRGRATSRSAPATC